MALGERDQVAVRMLAEAGADVKEKGANRRTLLHTAANRADASLVAALLQVLSKGSEQNNRMSAYLNVVSRW